MAFILAPQGAAPFLAGKLLAGLAIMSIAALLALVLAVTMFHVPMARAALAFLWATFAGGALFCYLLLLQLLASTVRGAQFLSSMIVFPLVMIGGSFFPFEVMPPWMASIGRWTPNGLAVTQTKALMFGRPELIPLLIATLVIGLTAVAAFFGSLARLRGRFLTS